ncbi:unnamed protein product [Lactuca virosa]|uniref:F-box domain-containing protein n=1 Tax=Lactuca virosa TaxID=75947 RepID=A0AAU9PFL2_9ASTR|nr:unnamed protein product [Lactuca virosa]
MTKNQNHHHDDASSLSLSSGKRFKTFDNGGLAPWSDLDHNVLLLVMMRLGFVDFFAFSRVCKSWRSFAISNRKTFMASIPPMSVCIFMKDNEDDCYYYLKDFEGRKFKPILSHLAERICVGSTCGYLVLFSRKTRNFWLVNPITRHELHFPNFPGDISVGLDRIRTILVFSPSIPGWVFVMLYENIVFYTVGKEKWNHVSSTIPILDLHFFEGKIYTLHTDRSLGELSLNWKQKHETMSPQIKNFLKPDLLRPELVSSNEKLYLIDWISKPEKVLELDFW